MAAVEFPRYTPSPTFAGTSPVNSGTTSNTSPSTSSGSTTPDAVTAPSLTDASLVNPDLQANNPPTPDAQNVANNPSQVTLGPEQTASTAPSLEDVRNGQGDIKAGDQGESIDRLSAIFMQIGLLYSGAPSRCYDSVMQGAVLKMQEENNLPKTGKVDQPTMRAIDQRMTSLTAKDNEVPTDTQAEVKPLPLPTPTQN